ncbi:hypothetical protein [Streptococcus mutans]|uniref:hypothetical protein n=1 Tax=Streptococcus mutans TaxID=1309 RepID=UPI0001B0571B|nr:hypothetical protein [Streptococcus mutans]EMB74107.1 hypothetical protein SMU41_08884 [Streptococcus mutans 2VS1]EMB90930.1 hypothetical protein SMU58_06053 [Streptococcus mutans A19]EMB92398.1 hypothetical protein SMU60_08855 [Streptococcus mutans U138]EMC04248.1 hypothetical protein SMU69_08114 [Streptococcus mutans NLML4]EMC07660.1 hypothetical protein SMU72_08173 [Streptococcus mutans NLML9]
MKKIKGKVFSAIIVTIVLFISIAIVLIPHNVYAKVSKNASLVSSTSVAKSSQFNFQLVEIKYSNLLLKSKKAKSKFEPKDSLDSTIEKIKTYEDYLTMYQFIVNEYITNYEAVVTQYGLGDAESYKSIRQGVVDSVKEQKKQYGIMKKATVIGKSDLIQFLKDYRDELKEFINQMSQGLQ